MRKRIFNLKLIMIGIIFITISYSQTGTENIKVMSYNIQTGSYYMPETPKIVDTLLNEWDIDILGTQELHIDEVKDFDAELEHYDWFGIGRDDGDVLGETSVIFYKEDKYEVLEHNTFWLSETPDVIGSESWNTAVTRIVTWGKFKIKSNDQVFYVFNTHFDHVSSWAREESAKLAKKVINEEAGFHPVIFTGDFNCEPNSTPYYILVENKEESLNLFDSKTITAQEPFGSDGTYNDFSNLDPTRRIDFIFVNPFIDVKNYGVVNEKSGDNFVSDHFPVYTKLELYFLTPPVMPELSAHASERKVNLSWDYDSEEKTYENAIIDTNDFQGYKLYRSKNPDMSDAVLIPGYWDVPLMRDPLMVCDIKDGKKGHTNYGIVDGFGYYLGEDSGLQHFYVDESVENDVTYYYVLTAYDNGIEGILDGYQPMENNYSIVLDNSGNVISQTKNTAVVTPQEYEDNLVLPDVSIDTSNKTFGTLELDINVFYPEMIKSEKKYKIEFLVDTLDEHAVDYVKYRHDNDLLYVNNGFEIWSVDNDSLVYREDKNDHPLDNIVNYPEGGYYHFKTGERIKSEVFEGLQISLQMPNKFASYSPERSGWLQGNADIEIKPSSEEAKFFPWKYEIVFTDDSSAYTGITNKTSRIYGIDGDPIGPSALMLGESFSFYVINKSFPKEDGTYEKLDLIANDKNMDGEFDPDNDEVLVGHSVSLANQHLWGGTVFAINFSKIENQENMPQAGDRYLIDFTRPFLGSDVLYFNTDPDGRVGSRENENRLAREFDLKQNYPNPFNSKTRIEFIIPTQDRVNLSIYNLLGQKVKEIVNQNLNAGHHTVDFIADNLSSGVYFYTLKTSNKIVTKKMLYIK